jgi:general secretion pathway protein K
MKARRGVALLAALWLVVAIAAIALQFSIESHERRNIGILASERGIQRAAAMGALAMVQAEMDQALRGAPTGSNAAIAILAASDPWNNADSRFSGPVMVDSMSVDVQARDLGEKLNINRMNESQIQQFFSFLLTDYELSTRLSQAILDWRDADSIPRPSGAERDDYIKAERLALPTNAPFREIEELQDVMGMTPEIYEKAIPYLTTHGTASVNLNTAPVPVLRALPGMTDATLNMILQLRSQGRRIDNVGQIFTQRGGRPMPGQLGGQAVVTQLTSATSTNTAEVELTITARVGPQAPPTKLTAIIRRVGNNTATITSKQW